jgi:hypothetical protein
LVARLCDGRILWAEDHANPVSPGLSKDDPQPAGFGGEKLVRHLDQDACTVARYSVAAGRAPVLKVEQNAVAQLKDAVRPRAINVDNRTYAARALLACGLIKPVSPGVV